MRVSHTAVRRRRAELDQAEVRPPPSRAAARRGVRFGSPPRTIRSPSVAALGLHPSSATRRPAPAVFSAACRPRVLPSYLPSLRSGLRTFGPTMPSADFCGPFDSPSGSSSPQSGTAPQTSRGKLDRLPCTVARSTLRVLDGYGLRRSGPARPTLTPSIWFLSIDPQVCSTLLSGRPRGPSPLRFASSSPPSG